MSFSPTLFFTTAVLLTGTAQAAWSVNGTHNRAINATSFYKSSSEVLSIPLKRVEHQGVGTPSLARRYFGTEVLGVYGAAYFAELVLGTGANPQTVSVLLDTGSFELWVNPNCTSSNVKDYCEAFGHYDPKLSPTAKSLNRNFGIQYGQGSASGVYYTDDVYLSGAKIQEQQFGVSNESSSVWFGIMGLGRGKGGGVVEYSSVVDSLAAQGYTNSKLFSLDLGGQPGPTAAVTGEMVFGGVDTNKYSGNLAKVPTDPKDPHYVVTLNSLTLQTPASVSGSTANSAVAQSSKAINDSSLPLQVVVDSGTTLSLLPESMVSALAANFPGAKSDGNGGYTVPCDLRNSTDGYLDFEFAGEGSSKVTITVSYSDFIWYGGDDCFLGAWYSGDIGVWILGDTFLRGAYATFDQDNNALYMANYAKCGDSNLVPVPAGLDEATKIAGACEAPAVIRPASPDGFDPDCDDDSTALPAPIPFTTAATMNRQASSAPLPFDEDCDDDDNEEAPQQHVAQFTQEVLTATETFTSTIIRHIVHTMSNQEVTSHETVVTTFCPGDVLPPPTPVPAPAPVQPHTQIRQQLTTTTTPSPVFQVTQAATTVLTHNLQVTTTERCETSTFTVTSCAFDSPEPCTVGMTTTQVVTMLETVRIAAYPSPHSISAPYPAYSSLSSPSPTAVPLSSFYTHPLSPPPPQSVSANAGVAYAGMSWGFNNGSSSSSTSISGARYNGAAVAGAAPSRGVNVVAAPAAPTKTTATISGFVMPTSGAEQLRAGTGGIGIGRGVGIWAVVMLAVLI
ncbi:acid protease [Hypoxylon sp. FL1857]|nr:acid protease [Hypoxylon sp. FL1857]